MHRARHEQYYSVRVVRVRRTHRVERERERERERDFSVPLDRFVTPLLARPLAVSGGLDRAPRQ